MTDKTFNELLDKYPDYFSFKGVGKIIEVERFVERAIFSEDGGNLKEFRAINLLVVKCLVMNSFDDFEVECRISFDNKEVLEASLLRYSDWCLNKYPVLISSLLFSIINDACDVTFILYEPTLTLCD